MKKLNKNAELEIQDKAKAREIIQVVLDYGINQSQIYHMVYLLALELEKVNDMKEITKLITKLTNPNYDKKTGLITTGDEP